MQGQKIADDNRPISSDLAQAMGRHLQLELGTSTTIDLGSVEHIDSVLESDLDDIFGRISANFVTDGEP